MGFHRGVLGKLVGFKNRGKDLPGREIAGGEPGWLEKKLGYLGFFGEEDEVEQETIGQLDDA